MFLLLSSLACTNKNQEELLGLSVLGYDGAEEVSWTLIGDESDGLNTPRDLGFNPERPGELWVSNRTDDTTTIFFDAAQSNQSSENRLDPYAFHFMEEVSSLDFGASGTFATCQESRNTYDDQA